MLTLGLLFSWLQQEPAKLPPPEKSVIQQIADSGRCTDLGESPDQRVSPSPRIAPGPPPLLSFRYYEGKLHHRYGNVDLVLDDAGH